MPKVELRETARHGYRSPSNVDLEAESEKKTQKKRSLTQIERFTTL